MVDAVGEVAALLDARRSEFGLPNTIDPRSGGSGSDTVLDVFERAVQGYGDLPAFTCLGCSLTYRELGERAAAFAAWLQQQNNLQPGDRIAIQLPNILQYPVAVFGALKAGLIVVNTNPLYTTREMEHQFNDAGAKAVVVLANMADKVEAVLPVTGVETVIVTEMADLHPGFKRVLLNFAVKYVKKMVPAYSLPQAHSFREVLQQGAGLNCEPHRPDGDDVAVLQYTGGTTGVAKGAMLTHRNLVANMQQVTPLMELANVDEGDIFIAPLPLYHIYAFMLHGMAGMAWGGHSVLIPNPRDLPAFVKELGKWPFTVMVGLNTLFVALMNNEQFKALNFSSLKLTLSGGMALSESVAKEWQAMTGCCISEGYGLTETSPVVTFNPPGHEQLGSIGLALPATYLKTVNEEGQICGIDEPGELCVSGPQVMKGYWQRPEATAETIVDGWLLTGDVAVIQPDGFVRIVDRKKDMILVSGFNVYPNELENTINAHPGVLESAAVGVPDDHSGEVVKMFVIKKDPALTEQQLQDYCHENLAGYKRPKYIEFRDELPKSNVGKILRRELREN